MNPLATAITIFVNRGGIFGTPVEDFMDGPLPDDAIADVRLGGEPGSHVGNFFDSLRSREQPISDVFGYQRAVSILHLANLRLLLDRPLTWDLETQQIVGDEDAKVHPSGEHRKGSKSPFDWPAHGAPRATCVLDQLRSRERASILR